MFDAGGSDPELRAAAAILSRAMAESGGAGAYTEDLLLEGISALYGATGDPVLRGHLLEAAAARGWTPSRQPRGGSPPFTLFVAEVAPLWGDAAWAGPFVAAAEEYRRKIARSADGLVLHPKPARWGGGQAVLVDSLQEYCRRMAWAGSLGGGRSFFDECLEQFALHRRVLRDPRTGLWSQGRGWDDEPDGLSPGAWSRGHGWLIRGMVESLRRIPLGEPCVEPLREMLRELALALLPRQDSDGMWHALPDLPPERSPIESSGTAMIASALLRAAGAGLLPGDPFGAAAGRAVAALLDCVSPDGVILHACVGPGPLRGEHVASYLDAPAFPPGEKHGPGSLLLAFADAIAFSSRLPSR